MIETYPRALQRKELTAGIERRIQTARKQLVAARDRVASLKRDIDHSTQAVSVLHKDLVNANATVCAAGACARGSCC